ncbi:MAG: transposase [Gammaproteobacteria bacterium]|nr:transposase [Gammaproteobacteria bacterium]
MPRANRYHVPGQVWHITHRCHQREFLLANRDQRQRWQYWLFEARRRYGLCVLNYIVTRNHIHLLVRDRGDGEIARSMQLVAGRAAQEFNRRRERRGAYWEDRYHATAVSTDQHLVACMRYIDLNMVRAGAVSHPIQWPDSGYRAIQNPRQRYRVIDLDILMGLMGCRDLLSLQRRLDRNVELALRQGPGRRQPMWSEPVAVGDQAFVDAVQSALGKRARARSVVHVGDVWMLADARGTYSTGDGASAVG